MANNKKINDAFEESKREAQEIKDFVMPSINGGRKQKIQQIPPQPPATPQAPAAEESAQKQY